jgi:uncharacterized coiled-coil protein SlyX
MSDKFESEYDMPGRWEGWGPPGAHGWEREARRKEKQLFWREKKIAELEARVAELEETLNRLKDKVEHRRKICCEALDELARLSQEYGGYDELPQSEGGLEDG